jgi:hypothetical protein
MRSIKDVWPEQAKAYGWVWARWGNNKTGVVTEGWGKLFLPKWENANATIVNPEDGTVSCGDSDE